MAIKMEEYIVNGRTFVRTYSDAHRYVVGGVPEGMYIEAIDPVEFGRTYTEGDIMPDDGDDATEEEQALTRYINEHTGASNPDLVSAAETLIKITITEE